MPFFVGVRCVTVTTSIPSSRPSFTPKPYIDSLHDHSLFLHLAPLITSTTPIAVPPSMLTSTPTGDKSSIVEVDPGMDCYEVAENVPIRGEIKLVAAFHDVEDGTGCVIITPMGLRIDGWIRVVKSDGPGPERWMLNEQLRVEGNWLYLPFMEVALKKSRKAVHEALIERVEKE